LIYLKRFWLEFC